jgi:hypothetical protein
LPILDSLYSSYGAAICSWLSDPVCEEFQGSAPYAESHKGKRSEPYLATESAVTRPHAPIDNDVPHQPYLSRSYNHHIIPFPPRKPMPSAKGASSMYYTKTLSCEEITHKHTQDQSSSSSFLSALPSLRIGILMPWPAKALLRGVLSITPGNFFAE